MIVLWSEMPGRYVEKIRTEVAEKMIGFALVCLEFMLLCCTECLAAPFVRLS